jgi:hypothetical protein
MALADDAGLRNRRSIVAYVDVARRARDAREAPRPSDD